MKVGQQSDYETRDVDYSLIHGETKEVFSKFVQALELKTGSKLLDLGGGYGSLLINILENSPRLSFNYDLLDSSELQLNKAKKQIDDFLKQTENETVITYIHQNAAIMRVPDNLYDVIVCKMFVHEIPRDKKALIFKNVFLALKPGGHVVFWNPDLNQDDYSFYSNTIRKKDELAKYNALAEDRHFLLNSELITHLETAGFSNVEKLFEFNYDLHTSRRLQSEFNNKEDDLQQWNSYIIEIASFLPPDLKKSLIIDVKENNIHLRFKRAVFKALKE